jgi:hypothetical protein
MVCFKLNKTDSETHVTNGFGEDALSKVYMYTGHSMVLSDITGSENVKNVSCRMNDIPKNIHYLSQASSLCFFSYHITN